MQRELPHVWKWFFALPRGSDFSFNSVKREVFFKAGFCFADSAERRYTRFVWPFQRVRTTQLVRDALPGGKSSQDLTRALRTPLPPGPSDAQLQGEVNLILHGITHPEYADELRGRYSDVEKPKDLGRIRCTLNGEKPFADDGRTGPSA